MKAAAFSEILTRGDIICFVCTFEDGEGRFFARRKFGVVLNRDLPDDPVFVALATSQTAFYDANPGFDRDVVRIPVGTYADLTKDTILSLRTVHQFGFEDLCAQYCEGRLQRCGSLMKVDIDKINAILSLSNQIEGWILARCAPEVTA